MKEKIVVRVLGVVLGLWCFIGGIHFLTLKTGSILAFFGMKGLGIHLGFQGIMWIVEGVKKDGDATPKVL